MADLAGIAPVYRDAAADRMPLRRRGTCQSLNLKTAKALGLEDYADQDYTPQYHGVIAAIAHKHTKVTPESPGGSGIPA